MTAARAAQAGGDVSQAVSFFQDAATAYEKQKRLADALDARVAAAELCPEDAALRADVAKALIDAGQIERAQPFLSADAAGEDVDLMLAMGRSDLLSGRRAEAHATLMRVVALAPDRQDVIADLSNELLDAGRVADAYDCLEILVDAALFEAAFDRAAAILETFVERHPEVAALLKLVDVYVDAGFDERIAAVQGRLADAYLDVGRAAEARVIAEDLLTRERHVEAHAERLRRALIALGVDDPEAEIARQLEAAPLFDEPLDLSESDRAVDKAEAPAPVADSGGSSGAGPVREEWTARPEPAAEPPPPVRENLEVDLSRVLADLHATTSPVPPAAPGAAAAPRPATREDQVSEAATLFERAQEQLRRGMAAEAAAALQAAARVPQFRFRAAAQLGRLSASRGDTRGAVEWLERAAEAPAPTPDEGFAVLYELADALDRLGEPARALAVFLELEADAGLFRDVRTRIEQLTRGAAGTTRSATGDRP
jgi:tetratricopeptide (TPR) repeat protein